MGVGGVFSLECTHACLIWYIPSASVSIIIVCVGLGKVTGIPASDIYMPVCPCLPGHSAHHGGGWPSESLKSFGILEAPFCGFC